MRRWIAATKYVVIALLLAVFEIISTPFCYVFYAAHIANMREKMRLDRIKLPLIFALYSQSEDMIKVFQEMYPGILACTDEDGNNVFHYLTEISMIYSERAAKCFDMLIRVFGVHACRKVCIEQKNAEGLTGLELSVFKSSIVFLTH